MITVCKPVCGQGDSRRSYYSGRPKAAYEDASQRDTVPRFSFRWLFFVLYLAINVLINAHFQSGQDMDCCRDTMSSTQHITSLEASSSKITPGLTTFENESANVVDVIDHQVTTMFPKTKYIQDITRHFSRPYAFNKGSLATGARGRIFNLNVLNASQLISSYPTGPQKLSFASGFRYTIVFTLQISASPFNQGLLCLNWQYAYGSGSLQFDRALASETCTNVPHVRLDIAEETSVQLRVPFVYSQEFGLNYTSDENSYGTLSLNTLVNFDIPAGTSAPTYTLYYHFEDMELFGANPPGITNVSMQSGTEQSKGVLNMETIKASKAVSTILSGAGIASGLASRAVPTLSFIFGPASWFLSTMSGVAANLGWSKPQITDSIPRMNPLQSIAEHNVDLPSSTIVVGPVSTNRLGFDRTVTGTDVDEMSFDFVKSQYGQVTIADMSSTDAAGTRLFSLPLAPAIMWFRKKATAPQNGRLPPNIGSATVKSFQPTSVMNLASYFKNWRGGFRFRVTFVKTKFHAGRVQFIVSYVNPRWDETNMGQVLSIFSPDFSANGPQAEGFNIVFNLKESNVCEFEVPFISGAPYHKFFNPIGQLSAFVVDPLKVNGQVQNSIQMLVEVCGAPDFEVAIYNGPWWPHVKAAASVDPYAVALAAEADSLNDFEELPTPLDPLGVNFQSGAEELKSLTPPMMMQNTIGESLRSFKQLIMIPSTSVVTAGTITAAARIGRIIQPWFWFPGYPTIPASWGTGTFAISGQVASCYAFVRGGTDAHVYVTDPNQGSNFAVSICAQQIMSNSTAGALTGNALDGTNSAGTIVYSGNTGVLHLRCPAYQRLVRHSPGVLCDMLTWGMSRSSVTWGFPAFASYPQTLYRIVMTFMTYASVRCNISAADDAYCHNYIGPMPFGLLGAAVTPPLTYDPDNIGGVLPAPV